MSFMGGNIQQMFKQAQALQDKVAKIKKDLDSTSVTGVSGGGLVEVEFQCSGKMKGVKIDPSLINKEDVEMLEDLIVAAVNNAKESADIKLSEEIEKAASTSGLPRDVLGSLF